MLKREYPSAYRYAMLETIRCKVPWTSQSDMPRGLLFSRLVVGHFKEDWLRNLIASLPQTTPDGLPHMTSGFGRHMDYTSARR